MDDMFWCITVPLRLFDCFGLVVGGWPAAAFDVDGGGREGTDEDATVAAEIVVVEEGRDEEDKGGSRIADGEGILIFAMP